MKLNLGASQVSAQILSSKSLNLFVRVQVSQFEFKLYMLTGHSDTQVPYELIVILYADDPINE